MNYRISSALLISLCRFDPPSVVAMFLWLLTMLITPLVQEVAGGEALVVMINAGIMMQAAAVLTVLGRGAGWRSALRLALSVLLLA
jgi:hypothetical protein